MEKCEVSGSIINPKEARDTRFPGFLPIGLDTYCVLDFSTFFGNNI